MQISVDGLRVVCAVLGADPADLDSWGDAEETIEAYEDLGFDVVERVQGSEEDFASRAAAHRSAFQPSRFRDEVYELVRATPPYRADLDCIAVAPDGSVAAYTLAWLDKKNRVGQFEPVGTHADHQRRGLGRAVNLFAPAPPPRRGCNARPRRVPGRRCIPGPGEAL
jgi:hypothetical protein